jgi:hypothetical protein
MPFKASGRGAYGPQGQKVIKGPLAPVWVTSGTLTGASTTAYSYQLVATDDSGDAPTYALASGSLNPGLSLSSTGLISGTATGTSNTANFVVRATDVNGRSTNSGTLTIVATLAAWNTASGSLGTFNHAAAAVPEYTLSASSGVTFSLTTGSLPPGVSLNATTGVLRGRPTNNTNTTYAFGITGSGVGERSFSITTLTHTAAVQALDPNTASLSYPAVYYLGTDTQTASDNVSRMQGYRNNIYNTLSGRGVPVTTYNQNWPFNNINPYGNNMIMTGGGGTDDGDSNVAYYSYGGTAVYTKNGNTNGTFTGSWVGFYNCYYSMGGGSVGSAYMEYFYNINSYPPSS